MTVVYIDSLFLLNFVVNYLLLLAAAKLSGEPLRRLRMAGGAALGAAYAAAVFFPHMGFLLHPLCKLGAAVLMLAAAFGGSKRLLRVEPGLLCRGRRFRRRELFALELLGGQGLTLRNGIFYSAMDLRLILLSAAVCYVFITVVFQRTAKHTAARRELVPAVLTLEGRRVALTALVDTGNTLTDPLTGRPVMVAEGEKLTALFPPGKAPPAAKLRNPVAAVEELSEDLFRGRCRLLPYQAVGVECGMLLALRLDDVRVGMEDYGGILVALSAHPDSRRRGATAP